MRRISLIFLMLLGFADFSAAQGQASQSRFDASVNAGVIVARPDQLDEPYYDSWYSQGRYSGSIGYYFTKHLKAEFEHAWSGEGSRLLLDYQRIGGAPYPYPVEQYFQLQQSTLRIVWQFRDNAWVHPYLSAGAVLDIERQRLPAKRTELRGGIAVGGGAKFYTSRRTFINTGAIYTSSPPARTVNFIAGFGFDW